MSNDPTPPICHRCGTLLTPGRGNFYIVDIQAYAENSPPVITLDDLAKDHAHEMTQIVEQMQEASPQEMMDTVHRRLTLNLCTPCYKLWIENPTA